MTSALRQCFAAAVRWRYISRNPAVDAGTNPEPRTEELHPFTRAEVDMLAEELGALSGPMVVFVAETGLRTNEWVAAERRDLDHDAITVQRRFSKGQLTGYPKTARRRVPLSAHGRAAIDALPRRLDTRLLFPAPRGGYLNLDNCRSRDWYPALEAAGIEARGPYCRRHTFATEALAARISTLELARLMGTSIRMIERTYGHYARDTEERIRARLDARSRQMGAEWASDEESS